MRLRLCPTQVVYPAVFWGVVQFVVGFDLGSFVKMNVADQPPSHGFMFTEVLYPPIERAPDESHASFGHQISFRPLDGP